MAGTKQRIAVLGGYWSTNIGNAFFQLGAEYALRQAAPDAHVFLIGDQPGYWKTSLGNPANSLDYVAHLDIDVLVLLGPIFRPEMGRIISNAMRAQKRKGARIFVLSAGMMQYDDKTVEMSRRLMGETGVDVFTTRDSRCFEKLHDLAGISYDGIDLATFVSDLFPPVTTDLPEYVVLNFDQVPEPRIGPDVAGGQRFSWRGEEWGVVQPGWRTEMSHKRREFPFIDALLPQQLPESIGPLTVVRTDHRYNPFFMRKVYKGPRSYAGDIPHSYLNIYANTACTFSNRVHACVATLSYGNPAMLFTRSPRAYLFERLGVTGIKDGPSTLDLGRLANEKQALVAWLRARLSGEATGSRDVRDDAA